MSASAILGIDPGLSGALALFDRAEDSLEIVDIPTLQLKTKRVVDEHALARLIDNWSSRVREVWLETPTPRPGQAVGAVATSLQNYGLLRGILVANFLPLQDVAPASWKRAMRVAGDKDEARRRASSLLPRHAHLWPLKKHDGRAEAALIALHGFNQQQIGRAA